MEKKIPPPPLPPPPPPPPPPGNYIVDFLGGLSGKRKSIAMDQAGTFLEYCIPRNSKLQQASSLSGIDLRGSTHKIDQFHYQNNFADTWQTSNGNLHRNGIESVRNGALGFPPQSSHYRPPFPSIAMPVGERYTYLNQQPQSCNLFGQTKAHNSVPFTESRNTHSEKAEVLQDSISLGIKNHAGTNKMSQQSSLQPNRFSDELERRTCSQESDQLRFSCELKQSGQYSNNARINDVQILGTSSFGDSQCTEQIDNNNLLKNEVQHKSSHRLGVNFGETSGNIEANEATRTLDMENMKYQLTMEGSPKNGDSSANSMGCGQKDTPSHGSLQLDEKSKLHSGKAVSAVAEKLWDGSIQLSSSVTLSAVAFFKSGEKLLDINWSEFVEVKGKVRLEAFEKYIQDLPRSRNRGLMVISLCWKEGSSKTGLTGMKEVAKGYKKGERVGYAQPSPGIDLYICPRSDKIITILAKYGFFKGMAAVEDNQDSMIGCVVWRKNQTSSNSVSRKLENKNTSIAEQPLNNSPSESSTQGAEQKMSPKQSAQEYVESGGRNFTDTKNVDPSGVQLEVDNSLSCDSSPFDNSNGAQPKASLGHEKPVIPLSSEVLKPVPTFDDDDDLPEFDFKTACGISQMKMSKTFGAMPSDKRVLGEAIRKVDRLTPQSMQNVQAISVSNQGSDHSSLPRVSLASSQGMPPLKRICDRNTPIPVLPNMEENQCFQSKASTKSQPKNLFDDDDDDMPEWCPPELHKKSLEETTRPSATISSQLPNPAFQIFLPGSSRPIFSSESQVATTHFPFPSQQVPPAFPSQVTVNVKMPPSRPPFVRAPEMKFNSNVASRPQNSLFDAKLPFHASEKRGWRP